MKVIFLDIDGVLNNSATIAMGVMISSEKVQLLNQLVEDTGAKIVISSSWRQMYAKNHLADIFRLVGFRFVDTIISYTPRLPDYTRGDEIDLWLTQNKVESYVIIDDDSDMLSSQQNCFVQTQMQFGLTYREVNQAKTILSRKI